MNSGTPSHNHTHASKVRSHTEAIKNLRVFGVGSHTSNESNEHEKGPTKPPKVPNEPSITENHGSSIEAADAEVGLVHNAILRSQTADNGSCASADFIRMDGLGTDFTPTSSMRFDGFRSSIGCISDKFGVKGDRSVSADGRRQKISRSSHTAKSRNSPDPLPLGYRQTNPAYKKFLTTTVDTSSPLPDQLRTPLQWSDRDPSPLPEYLVKNENKNDALIDDIMAHRPASRLKQGFRALEEMNSAYKRTYSKELGVIRDKMMKEIETVTTSPGDAMDQLKRARGIYDHTLRSLTAVLARSCQDHAETLRHLWDDYTKHVRTSEEEKSLFKDRLRKLNDDKKRLEFECSRLQKIVKDFKDEKREYAAYIRSQSSMMEDAAILKDAIISRGAEFLTTTNQAIWATLPIFGATQAKYHMSLPPPEKDDGNHDSGLIVTEQFEHVSISMPKCDASAQTDSETPLSAECQTDIISGDMLLDKFKQQTEDMLKSWISDDWGLQMSMEDDRLRSELLSGDKKSSRDGAPSWLHLLPKKRTPETVQSAQVESTITEIYNEYFLKFIFGDATKASRPTLAEFVLKFHYIKFGKRAIEKLQDMVFSVVQLANTSPRCQWFLRFCRIPNENHAPLLNKYFHIFIQSLALLIDGNGTMSRGIRPLQSNSGGKIIIPYSKARRILEDFLPDSLDSKSIQIPTEPQPKTTLPGFDMDEALVDFDKFTGFVMDKWISENGKRQYFLRSAFQAADGDRNQCIDKDELWMISKLFEIEIPESVVSEQQFHVLVVELEQRLLDNEMILCE
eukprot:TRINITY_DN3889_c0_g2_i2.p1 TRINITY_DN3889_c0_g2~~TRINITY_DN3889_c0_g2_i2.p1  ORF type:complete len:792 (-),score=179.08 TRINITY_DN3889_c0_g2_i2:793-3168(-)